MGGEILTGRASGRRGLTAGDVIVVLLVIAAAAASFLVLTRARAGERGTLAVVEVNGSEVRRFELADGMEARRFDVEGWIGPTTVEISGGRVRVVSSACRDKICVGHGWIELSGSSIVCLPNRVVVRVAGGRPPGVDAVTE